MGNRPPNILSFLDLLIPKLLSFLYEHIAEGFCVKYTEAPTSMDDVDNISLVIT